MCGVGALVGFICGGVALWWPKSGGWLCGGVGKVMEIPGFVSSGVWRLFRAALIQISVYIIHFVIVPESIYNHH